MGWLRSGVPSLQTPPVILVRWSGLRTLVYAVSHHRNPGDARSTPLQLYEHYLEALQSMAATLSGERRSARFAVPNQSNTACRCKNSGTHSTTTSAALIAPLSLNRREMKETLTSICYAMSTEVSLVAALSIS
jgi:hypothetical protein